MFEKYNKRDAFHSIICIMGEFLDKVKEEVSGELETVQRCQAVTVNVKEKSQYIALSCRAFYLSFHLSVSVEGAKWERVRSWIQQNVGGTTSVKMCCFFFWGGQFCGFMRHETSSYKPF